MPINRSRDRQFMLTLAGAVIMAVIVSLALAPRKVRAQMVDFARMGAQQISLIVAGSVSTPHNHATVAASHDKSSEFWPVGGLFEAPPSLPAEGWSPSEALVRSVFGDVDSPATAPAQLAAGLPFSSPGGGYSAESGWPSQQSGSSAGGGNGAPKRLIWWHHQAPRSG